jgi:hypothetical protein
MFKQDTDPDTVTKRNYEIVAGLKLSRPSRR